MDNDEVIAGVAEAFPDTTEFVILPAADFEKIRVAVRGADIVDDVLDDITILPLVLEYPEGIEG